MRDARQAHVLPEVHGAFDRVINIPGRRSGSDFPRADVQWECLGVGGEWPTL